MSSTTDSTTGTTTVSEGRAPVPDGELAYDVRGAGRPVVLLHGGWCDRRLWEHETTLLADDHLVVRYDARGCGASTSPTGDWEFHEDLRALLAHLGVHRPTLVGLSLGAATALDYALTYPDDVQAALLVSPGFLHMTYTDPWALHCAAEQEAAVQAWDAQAWTDAGVRGFVAGPHRAVADLAPDVVDLCRTMTLECLATHAAAAATSGGTFRGVGAQGRLDELAVPTETVVGDLDVSDILTVARQVADAAPGGRVHVVEGAAHMLNLEKPQEFAAVLRDFLARTA
ncbi:alpha/beta fold hydrolase [Kineosporia sp. A_224]|uniref:alpha/beta fold hydrolase n=1 Tax=Kineosporia sp. A_224 TaxID=1962180 RepID=UPI001304265D|nr:alpha/beta fold hydrolase [Kineosporia sp. A_224]